MGRLEEGLVRSMDSLRLAEPRCASAMFVFPLALMNGVEAGMLLSHESARDGDVVLFHREGADAWDER